MVPQGDLARSSSPPLTGDGTARGSRHSGHEVLTNLCIKFLHQMSLLIIMVYSQVTGEADSDKAPRVCLVASFLALI